MLPNHLNILSSVQLAIPCCMVAQSTQSPISGSSTCPSAFCRSDFSPWAAASCLNPCSTVAQHRRFLTLVSRFRPFACWPPSQPSYAFHPHHGQPILRSHDTRGSRHRFQPRPFAFRQLDHHPAPSFTQAFISPELRRRPDASPSSSDHDLHYQCPTTPHP